MTLHVSSNEASCSCHMFEFMGILCGHVLAVFIKKKVYTLPSHYILCRWTRNAKTEKVKELVNEEFQKDCNKASSTLLFNSVMVQSLELSERASRSEKRHDIEIQRLQKSIGELDLLEVEESMEEFCNLTNQGTAEVTDSAITLCDPPHAETKGHP